MRGLDSTLKSAGAGCQMGKGVVEQRGRRSGRDAIPPSGGGCFGWEWISGLIVWGGIR
jgi:hypothetical protein